MTTPLATPRGFAVLAALGTVALALPLAGLVARAPWSRAWAVLGSPAVREALGVSLVVSGAAAGLGLVLGLPLAWMLARTTAPGRGLARLVVMLPLVLPPVVAGVGLLTAFGRRGLAGPALAALGIGLPFTMLGAAVAALYVSLPLVVVAAEAGLRALDPGLEEAALAMGASPGHVFRRVTLPLLRPHLMAGLVLAWARALGEFGATLTFAGNLRGETQTLPLAVFELLQTDPDAAVLVALVLVAWSAGLLAALRGRVGGGR